MIEFFIGFTIAGVFIWFLVCLLYLPRPTALNHMRDRMRVERRVYELGCGVTELLAIALYDQHPPIGVKRGEQEPWDRVDKDVKDVYRGRVADLLS